MVYSILSFKLSLLITIIEEGRLNLLPKCIQLFDLCCLVSCFSFDVLGLVFAPCLKADPLICFIFQNYNLLNFLVLMDFFSQMILIALYFFYKVAPQKVYLTPTSTLTSSDSDLFSLKYISSLLFDKFNSFFFLVFNVASTLVGCGSLIAYLLTNVFAFWPPLINFDIKFVLLYIFCLIIPPLQSKLNLISTYFFLSLFFFYYYYSLSLNNLSLRSFYNLFLFYSLIFRNSLVYPSYQSVFNSLIFIQIYYPSYFFFLYLLVGSSSSCISIIFFKAFLYQFVLSIDAEVGKKESDIKAIGSCPLDTRQLFCCEEAKKLIELISFIFFIVFILLNIFKFSLNSYLLSIRINVFWIIAWIISKDTCSAELILLSGSGSEQKEQFFQLVDYSLNIQFYCIGNQLLIIFFQRQSYLVDQIYMKNIFWLVMVALFVLGCYSVHGIDIANPYSASVYTCLKNVGINFAIIRALRSPGVLDTNAKQSLQYAKAAGLKTDIYLFPCRGKSPTTQVNQVVSEISSTAYETMWIDVETNPSSGCSWSGHDAASNCNFLTQTVNAIKAKGKKAGIYSSYYMWEGIFGSASACKGVGQVPLWYAHYDNLQAFSDFKPFGGFTKPSMKQYAGDITLCNADIDKNWYP